MKHSTETRPVPAGAAARLRPSRLSVAVAVLALSACASIQPDPFTPQTLQPTTRADAENIRKGVEPINAPLTLEDAMARALKYNLDRRGRMMEEAIALKQLDAAKTDMLPKLLASAGYNWRDSDKISESLIPGSNNRSAGSISTDRERTLGGLDFSWSLLDLGLGYYGSRQQADRVLVATEKRRKAMHLLMQDVRTAYYRALAAQQLKEDVTRTIALAEEALKDSRTAEAQRLRSPVDSLRYQRQLLENLRLLEAIDQELGSAQIELVQLINAPTGRPVPLRDRTPRDIGQMLLKMPMPQMEDTVLAYNPDLREAHYNSRIAREEVRRTMARLFPNLSLNWGVKYDSDSYLLNNDWQEAGLQLSFNFFNLLTGPTQMKFAEAGVGLADQRRMAMQMGVLTQMYLARMGLENARAQFARADSIWLTDQKIAEMVRNRGAAQTLSQLDVVSNATTATLSLLRRYQALAQVHSAENRLLATLGMDPKIGNVDELTVAELAEQLRRQYDALGGPLLAASAPPAPTPAPLPAPAPARAPAAAPVQAPAAPQPVAAAVVPRGTELSAGSAGAGSGAASGAGVGTRTGAGLTASTGPSDAAATAARVRAVVQGWAQAWSARDMEAYVNFYAPDFKGSFKNRDAWLASRKSRIATRRTVEVDLSDIDVVVEGNRASATFRQQYRSNVMQDDTRRTLELRDVGGRWLITGESGR